EPIRSAAARRLAQRTPEGAAGAAARATGRVARRRVPRVARRALSELDLVSRRVHGAREARPDDRELHEARDEPPLRDGPAPDRGDGRGGDLDHRRPRLPDLVLHGARRVPARTWAPGGCGADAALGELPDQGVLVEADPLRGWADELGPGTP